MTVQASPDARREFERLLEPVASVAYRVAYGLARNADDAMDLVQDATVQAFRAFGTFQPGSNFKAWFLRILTNRFLKLRGRKTAESVPIEEVGDVYLFRKSREAGLVGNSPDPVSLVLDGIETEAVKEAIRKLPDDFRATAVLYFLDDMSYEQIAEVLEIPIGTVRSRLHRGRKLLQAALWDLAVERGLVGVPGG